ncbi:MAG: glycosyltransferase WbuB, partial [Methanomassiliicoccus sp.]
DIIGGATRNVEMAKLMSQFGSDVVVIANHPSYPFGRFKRCYRPYKRTVEDGITVYRVWTFQPGTNPATMSRMMYHFVFSFNALLLSLLLVKKNDVIISSIPPDSNVLVGHLVKKIVGCRWALDVRDLWQEAASDLGFVSERGFILNTLTRYKRKAYQSVDVFGYVNIKIKSVLQEKYGANSNMVHHPNGVDVSKYLPKEGGKDRSVIYVSNFGFSHDVDQLLRIMDEVSGFEGVDLTIIGDGERRAEVHAFMENKGIQNVHLLGLLKREEVPDNLRLAKAGLILINPHDSFDYAIPIKAIEYMACGLPVVGIAGPGTKEFFDTNACGRIFLPDQFDDLIVYLRHLDDHEEELKAMGKNGRTCAEKFFDKKKITERFWHAIIE